MLRCLFFLLFVAANQAFVARERREAQDIPAPTLIRVTLVDDPSLAFKVDWTPVSTPEGSEPVVGYKLKVWEQEKIKTYKYELVNGVKTLVEEYAPAKFPNPDQIPTHKPRDILVYGADKTTAQVDGIEAGVTYEARVLAFNKNGDGPLSGPVRIEVSPKDHDRQKDVYTVA
ncbi:hypothetical protein ABMA27_000639 [Loxostege sticticalis]|uniref:Fibronectin type-III domain-containing protein n=1 Tax=Loxostege sticticalis TaxID=481309 RepID=A0ABR3HZQ8_LOXSC